VASFFPFLAASIALGAFVWVGRDDGSSNNASVDESGGSVNEAAVEGSVGATISDGVEEEFGGAGIVTGTASPTVSKTTTTTAPSKEAIVETIIIPVSKESNDHDDPAVAANGLPTLTNRQAAAATL